MGRKAKLKKVRQQAKAITNGQANQKYNETQFVEQFAKMGYQVKVDPQLQSKTNRGNVSPEIPQARIEPQI